MQKQYNFVKDNVKSTVRGLHIYSFGALRKLYNWTLSWADTPYGAVALFIVAFAESSFFPIPPDILLIALCTSIPKKSFKYVLIATLGSVLGGVFGYFVGFAFYNSLGVWIIKTLHYEEYFSLVGTYYQNNAFLAILAAALTPIPYKVFTIAAGVWHVNIWTLISASAVGRGLRFFAVGLLIYLFGDKIKLFIDKYFNWLTVAFFALLIAGFFSVKYMM